MVFHVSAFCPLVSVTIRYCEPALGPRRDRSGERGHGRGALRIYKGRETFRVGINVYIASNVQPTFTFEDASKLPAMTALASTTSSSEETRSITSAIWRMCVGFRWRANLINWICSLLGNCRQHLRKFIHWDTYFKVVEATFVRQNSCLIIVSARTRIRPGIAYKFTKPFIWLNQ